MSCETNQGHLHRGCHPDDRRGIRFGGYFSTRAAHCQFNNLGFSNHAVFDWLDELFD